MAEKRSFASKFFWGIVKAVLILVFIVALAFAGLCIFAKTKYDVSVLSLIGDVRSLASDSGENTVVVNRFSDEDLASYELKEGTVIVLPQTKFTDKEVGAKLEKLVETDSNVAITFGSNDLDYFGVEIVQILFKNIPTESSSEKLCDINIVIHIDMRQFKADNLSADPQARFKDIVPDDIFVSCTSTVVKDETNGYNVTDSSITINALDERGTANIFNVINIFNSDFGKADDLAKSLGTSTVDAILGTNGVVGKLKELGVRDYYFEQTETSNNLVVSI